MRDPTFHTDRKPITATARAAKASTGPTSHAGKGKELLIATMPRPIRTAIDPSMSLAKCSASDANALLEWLTAAFRSVRAREKIDDNREDQDNKRPDVHLQSTRMQKNLF